MSNIETFNQNLAVVRDVSGHDVVLPITSADKPDVDSGMLERWQKLLTLMSRTMGVPAGLIMRLDPKSIEVFQSSETEGNPYGRGDSERLGHGLYCETVIARRELLHVPYAPSDPAWRNNPDVALNMLSYIGLPLAWPDGEIFGTICALDSKTAFEADVYRELLQHFQEVIENDLAMILERQALKRSSLFAEFSFRESIHRISNHLNMLTSAIQLKTLEEETGPDEYRKFLLDLSRKIKTVITVQSQLYESESDISLKKYLLGLAEKITKSFTKLGVVVEIDCPEINPGEEKSMLLGMLVSELVTNSLKHAFGNSDSPLIRMEIVCDNHNLKLSYRDNGPGIAKHVDKTGNMGIKFLTGLPLRLGGHSAMWSEQGMRYEMTIPLGSPLNPNPIAA